MKHHPSWTALRSYAITAGLACLMGVSYELFVFPNAFAPAGINGLATMLQYLLHINIGYLSLLINLPLVLLAWKKVDRDFARKTLVFVLVFSAVTLVLGQMDLSAIAYDSGSSAILGPVAAGVVSGAVYGWVIRQNGSTGGTDIVAAWVRKKAPGGQPGLADLQPQCRGGGVVLLRLRLPVRAGDPVPDLLLSQLQRRRHHSEGRQIRHEIRGGHPAAGGALPAAHAAAAPRCHCAVRAEGMYSETPQVPLLICVVNRHQVVRFQEILARCPDTARLRLPVSMRPWGEFQTRGIEKPAEAVQPPPVFQVFTPPPAQAGPRGTAVRPERLHRQACSSAAWGCHPPPPGWNGARRRRLQRWMMAHSPPLRTQTATGSMSAAAVGGPVPRLVVQVDAGEAVGGVVAVLGPRQPAGPTGQPQDPAGEYIPAGILPVVQAAPFRFFRGMR